MSRFGSTAGAGTVGTTVGIGGVGVAVGVGVGDGVAGGNHGGDGAVAGGALAQPATKNINARAFRALTGAGPPHGRQGVQRGSRGREARADDTFRKGAIGCVPRPGPSVTRSGPSGSLRNWS